MAPSAQMNIINMICPLTIYICIILRLNVVYIYFILKWVVGIGALWVYVCQWSLK